MSTIVFFTAALVSAFLLFLMQPMMGKFLLPWFGGTPLVWTVCMMFFQTHLLLGYAYAHRLSTRLPPKLAAGIHCAVLVAGWLFARFLPGVEEAPNGAEWPVGPLLQILFTNVSVPFFALSTTAPLLQHWFSRRYPERSPYRLYAVSNIGSLSAVLLYPFVFEPSFSLVTQETIFGSGYIAFGITAAGAMFLGRRSGTSAGAAGSVSSSPEERFCAPWAPSGWILLSGLGVMLLLSTTEQISRNVAVSSLFWMIPLCIYLLSFVFCFSDARCFRDAVWSYASVGAVGLTAVQIFFAHSWPVWAQLSAYGVSLLVGCIVCHGVLYRLRPSADRLTSFYLYVALGGALGGIFSGVVAPLIFPDMWEFPLTWAALAAYLLIRALRESSGELFWSPERKRRIAALCIAALTASVCFFSDVLLDQRDASVSVRSFFGRLAVSKTATQICLYHGTIRHGCQWRDEARRRLPTTYFGPHSGVGVAVRALRLRQEKRGDEVTLNLGVVGLGIGTSAAWTEKGDRLRFFEIDPVVDELARTYFSYLEDAPAPVDVVLGDARLSLYREDKRGDTPLYDALVIDAFSGDAIPLHLLTREALSLYRRRLAKDGILALHISNRYLNLKPLVFGLADDARISAMLLDTDNVMEELLYGSTWVLLTADSETENIVRALARVEDRPSDPTLIFTDQSSNLLDLL